MKEISYDLTQLLLFEEKKDTLLGFTETDEEMSMVLSEELYLKLPQIVQGSKMTFKVFKSSGFEDRPGLISKFTQPLAESKISIVVISTFSQLFLLIETLREKEAITSLQKTNQFNFDENKEEIKRVFNFHYLFFFSHSFFFFFFSYKIFFFF